MIDCAEFGVAGHNLWTPPDFIARRRVGLVVAASSAFRYKVAKRFTDALADRLPLSPDLHERVCIGLQEAYMNDLLHGNLARDATCRDTLSGLARWQDMIEARLALPRIAGSLMRMTRRIAVGMPAKVSGVTAMLLGRSAPVTGTAVALRNRKPALTLDLGSISRRRLVTTNQAFFRNGR